VFSITFVVAAVACGIVGAVWAGVGRLTSSILGIVAPGNPEHGPGLRALLAFVAVTLFLSGIFQSAFVITSVAIAFFGLGTIFFALLASVRLSSNQDRLALRSRSSPIGGGQTEWQISPALLFALLAFTLAGGTITLTALALRPQAPLPANQPPIREDRSGTGAPPTPHTSAEPRPTATPTLPAGKLPAPTSEKSSVPEAEKSPTSQSDKPRTSPAER